LKVVHLSTYDTFGGASIAALRLHLALLKEQTDSQLLVQTKKGQAPGVITAQTGSFSQQSAFLRFFMERLAFLPHERHRSLRFAFSPAVTGLPLHRHPVVQQADLLHLHWVNFGFLSISQLKALLSLGKPVVWTLHDMWAFTGGCHYAGSCLQYQTHCTHCPMLRSSGNHDLSWQVFEKKQKTLTGKSLHIVGCSQWMTRLAQESSLLKHFLASHIPNALDTDFFSRTDSQQARRQLGLPADSRLLLFGTLNAEDPRKGFSFLQQALHQLHSIPLPTPLELLVFGKANPEVLAQLPFKVHSLGSLPPERVVEAYSAADVLVVPSLEDNLPNVVAEGMACGLPVAAFQSGGIPEMVDHLQNGYLAPTGDASALAKGLYHLLYEADLAVFSNNARQKALSTYSQHLVASQYKTLYQHLLSRS
jgi:glycosyltransferase involved in cell wall biosynthesis